CESCAAPRRSFHPTAEVAWPYGRLLGALRVRPECILLGAADSSVLRRSAVRSVDPLPSGSHHNAVGMGGPPCHSMTANSAAGSKRFWEEKGGRRECGKENAASLPRFARAYHRGKSRTVAAGGKNAFAKQTR